MVLFKDDSRHKEARDYTPTQQRYEEYKEREDTFAMPDIPQISPILESCIFKALVAVNLMDDEGKDEDRSVDGDTSCYYSEADDQDDITCISKDTTMPSGNLSKDVFSLSKVQKKIIIPPGKMGVAIVDSHRGPFITAVSKSCPVNFLVGDVIDSVDGRDCRALSANQVLQILIAREDQHRFLMISRVEGK